MKKILFGVAALGLLGLAGAGMGLKAQDTVEAKASTTNYEVEIRFTRPSDWDLSDGDNVWIHTWGSVSGSYKMTWLWQNNYNQAVFCWTPSAEEPLGESMQFYVGNYKSKSSDLSAPTAAGIYNYYDDGGYTYVAIEKMRIYFYDYDSKFSESSKVYAHVTRNGASNLKFDDGTGIEMTPMSDLTGNDLIYYADVSNAIDRVTFTDGESVTTGETTGSAANYCYIYAPDSDIASAWWTNINYALAHNWAQNLLLFRSVSTENTDDTGACESKYATAKSVYNAFKSQRDSVLPEISSGFPNALARLAAWAEHNGEVFTVTDGVGSFGEAKSVSHYETTSNDNNAVTIAAIITAATVLGAGAFFITRKRRAE